MALAGRARPEVVLMDVRMPQGGGVDATRTITRRFPQIRVLALTAYDDKAPSTTCSRPGPPGTCSLGGPGGEFVAAVRKARRGEGGLDRRVMPAAVEDLRRLIQEERQATGGCRTAGPAPRSSSRSSATSFGRHWP